jgi:16S rRNA (uracil1498-N3)-methyltransferase
MRYSADILRLTYRDKDINGVYGHKMRRFFIEERFINKDTVIIKGREAHHIRDVVRLKKGERFMGLDGKGRVYTLRITRVKKHIIACIEKISSKTSGRSRILLACAIPKKNKMDDIVEKATELGVTDIIPMITERTIVKVSPPMMAGRQLRWQKIVLEASKQSGRADLAMVHGIVDLEDALKVCCNMDYRIRIIPFVSEGTGRINDVLPEGIEDAAVFIGPEGDFTPREITLAKACGFRPVSLGQPVLKVDTACYFALSVISARYL